VTVEDSLAGSAAFAGGDNGDGWLDLTETWLYTVAYTTFPTLTNLLVNIGSVTAADPAGIQITATDTHSTTLFGFTPILTITKDGLQLADVGDTIVFTFTVSHATGSDQTAVSNISVNDNFAGPATRITGGDDVLEMDEEWIYTASYTVKPTDPNPMVNTGTVRGQDLENDVISATTTHSTTLTGFNPAMRVDKNGPAIANVNDTVVFTFTVIHDLSSSENLLPTCDPGPISIAGLGDGSSFSDGSPFSITSVTDDVAGRGIYVSGDTDSNGKVDATECWIYTAAHTVTSGDPDPLDNVVTVQALDSENEVISETDKHRTDIPHTPKLKLVKTGPVSATVGQTVVFTFEISHDAAASDNTPVTIFSVIDNVAGQATPISGDNLLEVNDILVYTASYTVQITDSNPLVNTGTVQGIDMDGDLITDTGSHTMPIDSSGSIYLPILLKE
jgi:hypothetical protein